MTKKYPFWALIVGASVTPITFASGIFLQEATYANLGAVGAGDGVYTESATSTWTNPAVMSHIDDELTTITGTLLNLEINYYDDGDGPNGRSSSTLPVAGVFHIIDLGNDLKAGIALGSLGGATLDYGEDWQGSFQLTDVALLTYQFNPTLSYKVNDLWSVAGGVQVNYAFLQGNTSSIELDTSTSWAFGYNIGTVVQATDKLRLGLSYRSELNHEFEGDVHTNLAYGTYTTSLPSPAITDLSVSYQFTPQFSLMSSIQNHHWSAMESTDIDMRIGDQFIPYSIERDWDDVWRISLGGEYKLHQGWSFKAGYAYESSPLDDPSKQSPDLPVGEQHRYSIGVSKQFDESRLDIYYEYADFGEIDIDQESMREPIALNGHFTGTVHFVGAAYTF
ncbi:Outer membrane protein transport protein (OMPP1/FadL/TodX) [Vibrio sp. B1FIG11]|uniref:OmpP1/FadL family transporter n=1 Tax=Vibrio sp. B1FIG11 TaxID=2751177 RepID=UPI001AF4E91E|nr:outer membrane protein transport protein [Vibrio sp. B1FIG11]CAD7810379.1 Outer membrane protein transport protein (OMPP1/FadL/TodX) [Vibrio sp. B1FIG11]CAE6911893.1 Outer membrane protein transport protein (OMPP1/FadL/TodX) [Vibrio sp. B1FIG11]